MKHVCQKCCLRCCFNVLLFNSTTFLEFCGVVCVFVFSEVVMKFSLVSLHGFFPFTLLKLFLEVISFLF